MKNLMMKFFKRLLLNFPGMFRKAPKGIGMLSIDYPPVLKHLARFGYGLIPFTHLVEDRLILTIKMPKEGILTAKLRQSFKLYLVPDLHNAGCLIGMVSAFFDDHDEPFVIKTFFFDQDEVAVDLHKLFKQPIFDVHFFDENNHEFLGVRAELDAPDRFKSIFETASFPPADLGKLPEAVAAIEGWFGTRTALDDQNAFTVRFTENLFADDIVLIDARDEAFSFHSVMTEAVANSLVRPEPGAFQERDIAKMMLRLFPGEDIYVNPMRLDKGTELTDVLCYMEKAILLVQAKDSPNTQASLDRTIDRKRATIRRHIEKGASQLRGAVSHVRANDPLRFKIGDKEYALETANRAIFGLVVVQEMFDDDYKACSRPVLDTVDAVNEPCALMDYSGLHMLTLHSEDAYHFFDAVFRLVEVAREHGEYPKYRFLTPPPGV